MDSVYNNTFTPLNAGALWQGRAEVVNKYNVACVTCSSDTNGLLSLLQSQNDINYDFAESFNIVGGTPFNINDRIKAKNYRVMFENTSGSNQTYLRITTTYKNDIREVLQTSIPSLEACIVDNQLVCSIENVTVSGVVVDISGQTINTNLRDGSGNLIGSDDGSLYVSDRESLSVLNTVNDKVPNGLTVIEDKLQVSIFDCSGSYIRVDPIFTNALQVSVKNEPNVNVSGSVSVSSLPSIEITNTGFNVNNFPTSTEISNTVDIVGAVNVNKVVEPIIYDLNSFGTAMYADSINGAIVDNYGRDGWYWTNNSTTGGSNCYWYSNSIVPQNQMTKAQMDCVYIILALDRVNPNIVLPIVPMVSAPTGSGDIIPTFAHSIWTYTIPSNTKLNAGEVIMLIIGDSSKVADVRPELRRVVLEFNSSAGDALSTENIAYISLNTDSGLKGLNAIQYLLQNAGFHYSVNDSIVEYKFSNSVQKVINDNLTTDGIKINGTIDVSGNINVNNFPTSTEVSNFPLSFEISNLPSVQDVSGNVNVSNFPTSTEVSNVVSVYDSNSESINEKLTLAAAPNNDCIKVFQANNPTSIDVSNFPSGFDINNFPTGFDVNNFPTEFSINNVVDVSGSVAVSSLPAITIENTGFDVNNFPSSFEVSNFPTSTEVSNFPTSTEVSNFPTSTEVSNVVSVYDSNSESINQKLYLASAPNNDCIKVFQANNPTSIDVSNFPTSFQVSNFPSVQDISGNVNVGNFPVEYNVSGSVSIRGSVSVNTITGYASETTLTSTNTKLDTIHNDLDGLTFDASNNLKINVENTSLDTHMKSFHSGSWVDVVSASNGHLLVNSSTQDGNGNDITSSNLGGGVQALDVNIRNNNEPIIIDFANPTLNVEVNNFPTEQDVNITNASLSVTGTFWQATQPISGSVSVSGTPTVNIASNQTIKSTVYDFQNNGISSTNHTAFKYGLDTTSALATTDMTTRHLLTSTSDGGSKRGLDVNISSGTLTVDVDSVKIKDSSGNSIIVDASGNLNTAMQAFNRTNNVVSNLTTVQPVGASSSVKALEVYSYNVCLNNDSNLNLPITSTTTDTTQSMDTFVNNDSTTNFNSQSGLNVYPINPKTQHYTIGGFDGNSVANIIVSADAIAPGILQTTYSFGTANPREHWAVLVSPGINTLVYQYIDGSGNISQVDSVAISGTPISLGTFVSLLSFRLTNAITGTQKLQIGLASDIENLRKTSLYSEDINQKCQAVFTIPNGYIGYISNLVSNVPTTTNVNINKWTAAGVRSTVWRATNASNMYLSSGYEGTLGGVFNAGESIAFGIQTAAAGKSVFGNLVLKSLT